MKVTRSENKTMKVTEGENKTVKVTPFSPAGISRSQASPGTRQTELGINSQR